MTKYNWELSLQEFTDSNKAIRSPQYHYDLSWGRRQNIGYHYYLYLDEDLKVINPYIKKNSHKKVLANFVSTISREDVFIKAYNFIMEYARNNGLLDECI